MENRVMTQEILQVSPLPPFMMKALQEADFIVHDHTHIKDPGALSKVTAIVGTGAAKVDKKLLMMLPWVNVYFMHRHEENIFSLFLFRAMLWLF
jgi:hypothetical protein